MRLRTASNSEFLSQPTGLSRELVGGDTEQEFGATLSTVPYTTLISSRHSSGWVYRLAGLSRELVGGDTEQEVGSALGTVPYTAPEVFDSGRPTTSSDVYAFGILLWEMWHGKAAHAGLLEAQICAAVCNDGARPAWDAGTPPQLAALGSACWAQNPAARPSFQEVAQRLAFIEEDFRLAWHRQRQLRAAAAAELGFGNAARGMLTPPR